MKSSSKRLKLGALRKSPFAAIIEPKIASIGHRSPGHKQQRNDFRLSQEYRPSALHTLYKRYLQATLLVLGWDLFAVYKNNYQSTGNRANNRALFPSELRISQDSFDKWRRRVRIPVTILVCCLVTKLIAVNLVKIADSFLLDMYIFNSSRLQSLSSSSRALLDAFLSNSFVRSIMPTYYQTIIKQVLKLGLTLKKPYDSIAETGLLEVLVAVPVFYLYILVPLTLETTPLNAPIERFMLDPSREIARIDSATKRHLDMLPLEGSKSQSTRDRSDLVASMRPHTFDAKWFHFLHSRASVLTLSVLTASIMGVAISCNFLYEFVERPLCIIHAVENCGFRSIFTIRDSIYVAGLVTGALVVIVVYSLPAVVLFGTNIMSQLALVRAANDDLNRCLSMLRAANTLSLDQHPLDYNPNQSLGEHRIGINQPLAGSGSLLKNAGQEREVELCLLKTYVRLVVSLDEIKQMAHFIARIVETILVIVGFIVFTMLINSFYNDLKIPLTKGVLFFNCYIITYPLMLICSFAFARTVELEKVAWSILAELSTYQQLARQSGNPRSWTSTMRIEVLAGRWRMLVRSYTLSSRRIASQPFGLSITYRQVINIDFFVISIGLLLMKH